MTEPFIDRVRFTAAEPRLRATGIFGWITLRIERHVVIDGICVRRRRNGELALTFPSRRDRAGRRHRLVCPASIATRRSIERQILQAWRPTEQDQRRAS